MITMYNEEDLPRALEKMAKIVKRFAGNELLLFYLTKSGHTQSGIVEDVLRSNNIKVAPFLLTRVEPEQIGENGYKVYHGIVSPSKDGDYTPVHPCEIRKLGIPVSLGWDDIANQYRYVVGSTLYLAENRRSLGLRQYMLALHKDLHNIPLAHMSVDPYSDRIEFGDSSKLLLKIRELSPQKYRKLRNQLTRMIVDWRSFDLEKEIRIPLVLTNTKPSVNEVYEVVEA